MGKKKEKPSSEPTNCTQLESNEVQAQLTEAEDGVPSKKPKKHKRKKSSKKERDQEKQMVPSKQADLVETLMLEEDDQEILIDDVEMDVDDSLSDSASGAKLLIKTPDTPADKNLKVMQKSKSEKSKSSSNSKKSSKKRDGNKGEEDTDSEEERWLDAIESGKLEEVDDELKRIKNPRLMTARQRALMEKRSDGVDEGYAAIPAEPLLALPTGFKEKVLTEEMIAKKAIKSKRRREQVIEKREEDKKKTVDRLLKKQDSKISKVTRSKCLKKSAPLITYLDKEGIFLSYPFGTELPPIVPLAESMNRMCKNDPNRFCYICGKVTMSDQQSNITHFVRKSYHAYFGVKLGDQDKAFAPHMCCKTCVESLRRWSHKKVECLPFGVPMVWRERRDHTTDCYFCMTNLQGINRKNKQHVKYPDVPSAIKPVPHGPEIPIPTPPDNFDSSSDSDEEMDDGDISGTYQPTAETSQPKLLSQAELNDLTKDLCLSKESAQLLGSRLRENRLLQSRI